MIMNLGIILVIALIAYWWGSQGFFSSLLNTLSVLVAGALALAFWEPLVYLLAPKLGPTGVDMIWGITLIVTFSVLLLLFRMLTDKACPANVNFGDAVNWIGGGVLGAVAGIITAGILLIGLQFIQGPTVLMGYQGWTITASGDVEKQTNLWVPADRWTADFYALASVGPLASREPLAKWHPRVSQEASLYRVSFEDGQSRQGMLPSDYTINQVYKVDLEGTDFGQFVRDAAPGVKDPVTGNLPTNGDVYVIRTGIKTAAWDNGSRLRLSKAQVRLVVRMPNGDYVPVHPHAFYQAYDTAQVAESRFTFDAGDVYATSVGAPAEMMIAWEFLVPAGATPHHLMIRNARQEVTQQAQVATVSEIARKAATGVW